MKSLITSLLIGVAAASPVLNAPIVNDAWLNDDWESAVLDKRQAPKGAGSPKGAGAGGSGAAALLVGGLLNSGYGKVPAPAGAAPIRVNMPQRSTSIPNSKTVKLRYGPYKVPNMGHKNLLGEEGALWNYPDKEVPKPCEECVIVGLSAGLEYPDGKNANIDTGMWLHHFVQFTIGPGRADATCFNNGGSLPHMLIGSNPKGSERFFSSGNERTAALLGDWPDAKNVGYHLKKSDKFAFIVDLMNENMEDKVVYLTITYDLIDGIQESYADMKPVWFDAAQCGTSEVRAPQQNGSFVITAQPWTANFEGDVLGSAGHLHDGGASVDLEVAGQGNVCNSEASYGGSPEYINPPGKGMAAMSGGHGHSASKHISKMSICIGDKFKIKRVQRGQVWTLKANYDYEKNPGMLHGDGKQSTVMGIAIMFVKVKPGEKISKR